MFNGTHLEQELEQRYFKGVFLVLFFEEEVHVFTI
jgi:hypothetical protein